MKISVQISVVLFVGLCAYAISQPCHCDDNARLAICSQPMSLIASGCRLATKVIESLPLFRRLVGQEPGPPKPQNFAFIAPHGGQYTVNGDSTAPLMASAAATVVTDRQTVVIIVLSVLVGVCVVFILGWVVYVYYQYRKREARKRRAEENIAAFDRRRAAENRRSVRSNAKGTFEGPANEKLNFIDFDGADSGNATASGNATTSGDAWASGTATVDIHQKPSKNGQKNTEANKSVPFLYVPWQYTRWGLALRRFRYRSHLFQQRLFRTGLGERSLCTRLRTCRRRHVRVTGRYVYLHIYGERWLRIKFR